MIQTLRNIILRKNIATESITIFFSHIYSWCIKQMLLPSKSSCKLDSGIETKDIVNDRKNIENSNPISLSQIIDQRKNGRLSFLVNPNTIEER